VLHVEESTSRLDEATSHLQNEPYNAFGGGTITFGRVDIALGRGDNVFGEGTIAYRTVDIAFGRGDNAFGEGTIAYRTVDIQFGQVDNAFGRDKGEE
jgi:hypothetical protein